MSREKVRKVVIPVAGLGTRFLPVTKVLPKELLPIVNKPIIHYIVKEAIDAGIETVVFVTSRTKIQIEDYFDPRDLASFKLEQAKKSNLIDEVLELSSKIEIVSVKQYVPKGLGHAILQAKNVVSGQPFAVILGDDIILSSKYSAIDQCIRAYQELESGSVIGALEVPKDQSHLYGIMDLGKQLRNDLYEIKGLVEKPAPADAPSNWAIPGRYVFENEIFSCLENTKPGKNGEIQLTDGMQAMLAQKKYYALKLEGERHDTGDRLGYIYANISVGLEDPALKKELYEWLKNKLSTHTP